MGQNIINRIQQLVAKAESTEFSEEADAIMVMVRKLLEAHGISLLQVAKHAGEYDPVGVTKNAHHYYVADNWVRKLSDATSMYYGCDVVWSKVGNRVNIALAGRESCRAAVTAMLPYFIGQVRRLAKRDLKAGLYASKSKAESRIGLALTYRLYALYREHKKSPAYAGAGLNMLVPVNEIQLVLAEAFPHLKSISLHKKPVVIDPNAVRTAAEINLADQLREDPDKILKISG